MSHNDSVVTPATKDSPGRLRWGLAAIFLLSV